MRTEKTEYDKQESLLLWLISANSSSLTTTGHNMAAMLFVPKNRQSQDGRKEGSAISIPAHKKENLNVTTGLDQELLKGSVPCGVTRCANLTIQWDGIHRKFTVDLNSHKLRAADIALCITIFYDLTLVAPTCSQ
ncbi:hypothetical protein PoB_005428200 [Plakobranchus ocellatus]|uniref:Uncharacterized protein n=1 Tax=Plakobranchus ocellatus TaxID=259542 RepID=A0AAV4C8C1_9GAST|nr:hypothetical protein PoB_005428200 [Plakobranchus ocellatus]